MLSVIIATRDSERPLVATLAALVPGATAGLIREVIVADGGSHDGTERVADVAGCIFLSSGRPLGSRLKAAAAAARGKWLMFLDPGVVPQTGWIDEIAGLIGNSDRPKAAVFSEGSGVTAQLRRALRLLPRPGQGLVIATPFYGELGGHRDAGDPGADLLRRIGRRPIARLGTIVDLVK